MLDLKQLTTDVCRIATEVGSFLKEERKNFRRERVVEKHAHDYVSYVDKESEVCVVKALTALLPEAGFITEEGSAIYQDEPYCWVIDPLDGTTNYIHDEAPYCVSIALRSRTELLLGVVYEVCRDECFYAWKGGKAFMNGEEIHVSNVEDIKDAFVITELPYNHLQYKQTALHLIDQLYGVVGGIRMNGSAAAAICYVAIGRFDAWMEAFLGKWDYSAAALIVQEAGGKVTEEIHVSNVENIKDAFVITELPYNHLQYKQTALHLIDQLYGVVGGIRMNGSAAAAICYVAIGRFDAWMEAFLGKWDYSAAALIVQEAGGKVTNFYGEDHFIEGHHILATNGNLHPFFQKLLAEVPPLNM